MKRRQAETFYYELGTLLDTGFPIFQALDMMEKPFVKDALALKHELTEGNSLCDSMGRIPGISPEDAQVVKVAEETGRLSEAYLELNQMHRKNRELKEKLISFAVYPVLMLVLILVYLFFAMFFMVPMMTGLLRTLNVTEGFLFQLDLLREVLQEYWPAALMTALLILALIVLFLTKGSGALRLVLGKRYRLYREVLVIERMTKLLKGGRSILEILELSEGMTGIDGKVIREGLLAGDSLSDSFGRGGFSREFTAITRIHEEGGNLVSGFELFLKSSRTTIDATMERRIKLLEPLSMVLIGSVVGVTVISIMGPLMDAFGRIR